MNNALYRYRFPIKVEPEETHGQFINRLKREMQDAQYKSMTKVAKYISMDKGVSVESYTEDEINELMYSGALEPGTAIRIKPDTILTKLKRFFI